MKKAEEKKKKFQLNRDSLVLILLVIAVLFALVYFSRHFYTPKGDNKSAQEILEKTSVDETQPDDPPKISSLALKELIERGEKIVIINPESKENYYKKHIPGSISFPHDQILANIGSLPRDYIIIVTSTGNESGCDLSKQVSRSLIDQGFPDVRDHHDGWMGWEKEGFPTATENEVQVPKISGEDLIKKIEDREEFYLLDVREEKAYQDGHLKNAINIPYFDYQKNKEKIPHDTLIIIYDQDGKKSEMVAKDLLNSKYTTVKTLLGGIDEWKQKDRPLEK